MEERVRMKEEAEVPNAPNDSSMKGTKRESDSAASEAYLVDLRTSCLAATARG